MAGASQTYCYNLELQVLHKHAADVTSAIATNPFLFGQHLVQHGLAVQATVTGIVDTLGINDYQKGSKLLGLVDTKLQTAGTKENARRYFDDFLGIIAYPMGQRDIADLLVATYHSKDPSYKSPLQESDIPSISRSTSPGSQQTSPDSTSAGAEAVTTENKILTPCLKKPDISGIVHKLEGLSVDHRTELQSRLYSESTGMVKKFNTLFLSVRQSLDRRQVPPKDVKEVLMGFGSFKPVSQNTNRSAFEEDFEQLQSATTIQDLMQLVRSYCNFFSYDIIEELVNHLGDGEDRKALSQYTEDFNTYAERKVYEGPAEFSPITDSGQAIVCVTLDENYDECTLSHLRLLHNKLCHILKIKGVLRLCRVEPGSIKVIFSIPKLLQRELFPLSVEQEIALFSITTVKITKFECGQHVYLQSLRQPLSFVSNFLRAIPSQTSQTQPRAASIGNAPPSHLKNDSDETPSMCTICGDSGYAAKSDELQGLLKVVMAEAKLDSGSLKRDYKKGHILRGTAKYECDKCGHKWKLRHSAGQPKPCTAPGCDNMDIQPYDFDPDPWKQGPREWRVFGLFKCRCGRHWPSAYTWINWDSNRKEWIRSFQACKASECKNKEDNEVLPHSVRPLLWNQAGHSRKQHLTEYCEKCKELGRNCRHYVPPVDPNEEGTDFPDDVSILSDSSSVDSEEDNESDDHNATPVPSDEETNEELLSRYLNDLRLPSVPDK